MLIIHRQKFPVEQAVSMRYAHYIIGSGVSPHPVTPCQIAEKADSKQKQKTFWDLWSQGLVCLRFTHQGVSSWWVDTWNFDFHLLLP